MTPTSGNCAADTLPLGPTPGGGGSGGVLGWAKTLAAAEQASIASVVPAVRRIRRVGVEPVRVIMRLNIDFMGKRP
jgi:hypothetical protein